MNTLPKGAGVLCGQPSPGQRPGFLGDSPLPAGKPRPAERALDFKLVNDTQIIFFPCIIRGAYWGVRKGRPPLGKVRVFTNCQPGRQHLAGTNCFKDRA